jgi:hypothetical protein
MLLREVTNQLLSIMDINHTNSQFPSLGISSPSEDGNRTDGRRQAEPGNVRQIDGALFPSPPKRHGGETARHTALTQRLLVNDASSKIASQYASFTSIQELKDMRLANRALPRTANTNVKHVKVNDAAELQAALNVYREDGLTSILLSDNKFTDAHLELLQNIPLETVQFDHCGMITNDGLGKLHPRLKALSLFWCGKFTDDGFFHVPRGVEHLEIWGTNITGSGFPNLPEFLKILALRFCRQITGPSLSHIPVSVEELDLSGCDKGKITPPAIEALRARLAPGSLIIY